MVRPDPPPPSGAGIPPGTLEALRQILRGAPAPMRRRAILEELDRRGHRISLAGLNRALDFCRRSGWTNETPEGVRMRPEERSPP